MEVLIIIGVCIVSYFLINGQTFKSDVNQSNKLLIANQNKLYAYLRKNELDQFKKYISNDYKNGIIFDESKNELWFFSKKFTNEDGTFEYSFSKYKTTQVIQSEIIIDNNSVYKTERGNQLLGAAVGGIAFGNAGAIVGGLTGTKTKETTIKNIDLKISVDDFNNPTHKISFLSNVDVYTGQIDKNGYSAESSKVKAALNHIERWRGIMEIIIKQQNM